MSKLNNLSVLSDFVQLHGLSKSHGWSSFKGNIVITTPNDFLEDKQNVRIWFSGYSSGNVVIEINKSFDYNSFPSEFWASAQEYKLEGNQLVITGRHPKIGNYSCSILPA